MKETFGPVFPRVVTRVFSLGLLSITLQGCVFSPSVTSSLPAPLVSVSPSASAISGAGVKVAKIFFQASLSSSFDLPSSNLIGTAPGVGLGLQAQRIYNGDGSSLASKGYTDPNWPAWLKSFEIGLSGSANSTALEEHCANFVYPTESTSNPSCLTSSAVSYPCGAPLNQFRVSEWDCTSAAIGNGSASDGIYLRAVFNRNTSVLGSAENIMVTLEYSASGLNAAPTNPMNCYSGGIFNPESCSDFTWRAYLKRLPTDVVQPFLMLVPPISSSSAQAGTGITAKQIFLPLAADPALTTFQISRTGSTLIPTTTNFNAECLSSHASGKGDSPLCAGVIFYSITFYRI